MSELDLDYIYYFNIDSRKVSTNDNEATYLFDLSFGENVVIGTYK